MLCYKDQTFCSARCAVSDCPVMLTDEVERAAQEWWGKAGAPLSVADLSRQCAYYEPIIDSFSSEIEDIYDEPIDYGQSRLFGGAE